MGFFKDVVAVSRTGRELRKDWDPVAHMKDAQLSMAHMTTSLQALTDQANASADPNRVPATATVTAARETGQYINMQPMVAIDLLVSRAGGIPVPVTVTEIVAPLMFSRIQPGAVLGVSVGAVPTDVIIDWRRAA